MMQLGHLVIPRLICLMGRPMVAFWILPRRLRIQLIRIRLTLRRLLRLLRVMLDGHWLRSLLGVASGFLAVLESECIDGHFDSE